MLSYRLFIPQLCTFQYSSAYIFILNRMFRTLGRFIALFNAHLLCVTGVRDDLYVLGINILKQSLPTFRNFSIYITIESDKFLSTQLSLKRNANVTVQPSHNSEKTCTKKQKKLESRLAYLHQIFYSYLLQEAYKSLEKSSYHQ